MNEKVQTWIWVKKIIKETWEYQEELFKGIVDLKIKNRREELDLKTPNYCFLWNIRMFILSEKAVILAIFC